MKKLSSEYIRDIDAKSRRSNFCIKVQVCDPAILKGQAATTGQLLTNDGYKNRQQYNLTLVCTHNLPLRSEKN